MFIVPSETRISWKGCLADARHDMTGDSNIPCLKNFGIKKTVGGDFDLWK